MTHSPRSHLVFAWLAFAFAIAAFQPTLAHAWDVRCVEPGGPTDVECRDPFANARTPWVDHPNAEHLLMLVNSLQIAGLPNSLQNEFSLIVYTGSETFEASGGVYDSVRPVLTGAELEQERRLTIPMMASLPDFSYTLWDWASGNEQCPPAPTNSNPLDCHNYESHIGWLNSNHMLPQARNWYRYLHSVAVERASACKDLHDSLDAARRVRFFEWLAACEKEALVLESVAQHYLHDAWATGHMLERWGSTEISDFGGDRALGFAVSGFVGALHGSKAMLDDTPETASGAPWDDPMNAPHLDVRYIDSLDGLTAGVGDRFLPQLLDAADGLDDYTAQRESLFGCAVDGLREVYSASAQLHGPLAPATEGFDVRRQVEDDSCWAQRVTNVAYETGLGVHQGPFDGVRVKVLGGVTAWMLGDVLGAFLLESPQMSLPVRARFRRDIGFIAAFAGAEALLDPNGTNLASGTTLASNSLTIAGIGPNSQYASGGAGVPPSSYSDPLLPWGLSDPDPRIEERKQVLNLTFADAHAADRCSEFSEADLEAYADAARAAVGADPEREAAACGQCVQMLAPHLRFGVAGNYDDTEREAFCALVGSGAGAFVYTGEDIGTFPGNGGGSLDGLHAATNLFCGCAEIAVSITPFSSVLSPGDSLQFLAQVLGAEVTDVTWTTTEGSISSSGLFTASSSPGNVLVRATSVADPDRFAEAIVVILEGEARVRRTRSRGIVDAGVTNGAATGGTCVTEQFRDSPPGVTEWTDSFSCSFSEETGGSGSGSATASFLESFVGDDLRTVTASGHAAGAGSSGGFGSGSAEYELLFSVLQPTTLTIIADLRGSEDSGHLFLLVTATAHLIRETDAGPIDTTLALSPGDYALVISAVSSIRGSADFDLHLTLGP